jgi:hypothetical protein
MNPFEFCCCGAITITGTVAEFIRISGTFHADHPTGHCQQNALPVIYYSGTLKTNGLTAAPPRLWAFTIGINAASHSPHSDSSTDIDEHW